MPTTPSQASMPSANPSPRDFIRLLMENERRLYTYIRSLLGNSADAEDVLQETSIILWDKFSEFDQTNGNFIAWAFKTAYFNVQNFRRKKDRSIVIFTDSVFDSIAQRTITLTPEIDDRHQQLAQCIEKLTTEEQKLLALRYEHASSIEAITEQTGRTAQAIYKALSRIRATLLECVQHGLSIESQS